MKDGYVQEVKRILNPMLIMVETGEAGMDINSMDEADKRRFSKCIEERTTQQ